MLRVLLLVVTLLAAPAWSAQKAEGKRFLFIIDTSAGMKPLEMPLRQTLFDLIYSGARGHMTNDDTYGVWLVGEKNNTSFPMESWKEKFAVEIAAKAVSHAKDHGFKGQANLTLALADASRIVKHIGDLTVILISNGETSLLGTPFDDAINARFRELAPAMKTAKATVNTALVARDGKFVAWAANSPQFLLDVPYVAPKPKPAKVEPPVVAVVKPAKVVAAPPRVAANPLIITKESVAEERRTYVSSATTTNVPPAPVVAAATNAVSAPLAVPATNVVATVATNLTNDLVAKSVAPATSAVVAVTTETRFTNAVAAPAALPPVASGRELSFIFLCAGAGAGGAFVIVLAVLFFTRASRREPSLISQAIARERMEARRG